MSYSIWYTPEQNEKYKLKRKTVWGWRIITIAAIFVTFASLALFRKAVVRFLLPGDPVVTEQAAQHMLDSIRNGDDMYDAVTTFCIEVLTDGMQDPS